MEHLPHVEAPALPLLSVPYYGSTLYDGGPFLSYPSRRNFSVEVLESQLAGDAQVTTEQWLGIADTVQTWLYMGLLHEFFFRDMRVKMPPIEQFFVSPERTVCTWALRCMFNLHRNAVKMDHVRMMRELDFDMIMRPMERRKCLVRVGDILMICGERSMNSHLPLYIRDLLLSVVVLHHTLRCCFNFDFGDRLAYESTHGMHLVRDRLQQSQWCSRHVSEMASYLDPLTLLYVGQLKNDHQGAHHRSCTPTKCQVALVDLASYQTKHHGGCTGCQMNAPNLSKCAEYFDRDSFPVLSVKTTKHENNSTVASKVEIMCSEDVGPYVAISHVWADGLGNTKANALPWCQLQHISNTLHHHVQIGGLPRFKRQAPVPFWIDTICVPVKPDLRTKALSTLSKTFSRAAAVVVLDSDLQKVSIKRPYVELIARIRASQWMTRLWTLEESIFAPSGSLYFLLKDGLFLLSSEGEQHARQELQPLATDGYIDPVTSNIQAVVFARWNRILSLRSVNHVERIVKLGQLLHGRVLTKAGDEAIIVGSILDVNTKAIKQVPPDKRMQKLLDMVRFWPMPMLFTSFPRLKEPGYRWAARSLLQKLPFPALLGGYTNLMTQYKYGQEVENESTLVGEQTPRGFQIELVTLNLEPSPVPLGRKTSRKTRDGAHLIAADDEIDRVRSFLWFWSEKGRWFRVVHRPPFQEGGNEVAELWEDVRPAPMALGDEEEETHSAIILPRNPLHADYVFGVLVHISSVEDAYGVDLLRMRAERLRDDPHSDIEADSSSPGSNKGEVWYGHYSCNVMVVPEDVPDFDLPASVKEEQLVRIKEKGVADLSLMDDLGWDSYNVLCQTVTYGKAALLTWCID